MANPEEILADLIDQKTLNIIKFFMENEKDEFYLREIAKKTDVSAASTFRILNKLLLMKIIDKKEGKTSKLYTISDNKQVEYLKKILNKDKTMLDTFVEFIKGIPSVEMAVIHGKLQKDKMNALLIGNDIDMEMVNGFLKEIKQKYNYNVSILSLTIEQYHQMTSMGLYQGEKKVIYRR